MAAAKDGVKIQLNLKAGNDLLNVYATNVNELESLVTEFQKTMPATAKKFGLLAKDSGAAAVGAEVVPAVVAAAPPPSAPAAGAEVAAEVPSGSVRMPDVPEQASAPAPTSEDGEALSPREKARLRLKGGK